MPYPSVYKGDTVRKRGAHLTPKMSKFVDLYMLHGSGTKAIKESDYKYGSHPDRLASRLLAHPAIRQEIEKRQAKMTKKFEVTAEYLVEKLAAIVNRTEEDNPQAALRAIELLGKTIAIWRDRQEITGADGEAIKHEQTIKENATDFTNRLAQLAAKPSRVPSEPAGSGTDNIVVFPERGGASGT